MWVLVIIQFKVLLNNYNDIYNKINVIYIDYVGVGQGLLEYLYYIVYKEYFLRN